MADNGVLGRLPKWPRNALNNSVIAAEQAYRKRSNLPLLTDADMEALRAGVQMPWETGDGSAAPAAPAAATPVPVATAPAAPAAPAAAASAGTISPEVAALVAQGKKWSRSSAAAERARRNRKGFPPLTGAEVTALLGEPENAAAPAAAPAVAAAPTAAVARPAAAAVDARPVTTADSVARSGASTSYVGTPAVGTSKAAAAG